MTKPQILELIKKKYPKNQVIVEKSKIINMNAFDKKDFRVYVLDSTNKCIEIQQHGPANSIDFYKSTYSMTMQKMNDTTWCLDKENIRTMVIMHIYPDSFISVTSEKKLGFLK